MIEQKIVLIAGSAGSLRLVKEVVERLPAAFYIPIVILLHLSKNSEYAIETGLDEVSSLRVGGVLDKQPIENNRVYIAPGGYHLLIEKDFHFALSYDAKVHYCRPSIDVLFCSAALSYGVGATAILLSGSNVDGAEGALAIRQAGGEVWVQDPAEAEFPEMPKAAINLHASDFVGGSKQLTEKILEISRMRA
jgi:two-component system chemotaxis response regulator CheB